MNSRVVLIYKDVLLMPSESYILSQGDGLSEFEAFYVGSKRVSGVEIPAGRSSVISDGSRLGRCREILFKAFGVIPSSMRETLGSLRPALIHAHFGPDGFLAQTLARSLGIPLLVTFHGYDATSSDSSLGRMSFSHKKYLKRRDSFFKDRVQFIAVSEFIRRKLLGQGVPEDKIIVHYIGVDTDKFEPSPQVSREQAVLFVGRLVEVKGCTYLIKAMKDVQDSFPEAELVVIGDGPQREQLEEEARRSLKKSRFLGAQPQHVVKEWMNRAKVFSVPSITAGNGNAEGFGLVFAEAQAMGVPVVSSRSGGISEAVSDGETGFLLPERDWAGLAESIKLLLGEKALWARMSEAGRARVKEKFDLRRQNRMLEQIYKQLMAG